MRKSLPSRRVFISYSHRDEDLVRRLEKVLRRSGLTPTRDKNFAYGVGFDDQIKKFIEYAHVFMPVITAQSSHRGWVHQEIGYAMSRNIPVLPVCIGKQPPGEWLQMLHSVMLRRRDVLCRELRPQLRSIFSRHLFENLIRRYRDERHAHFICGFLHEDRTAIMIDYANDVSAIQSLLPDVDEDDSPDAVLSGFVRQRGALSTFHIPDAPVASSVWKRRYGNEQRTEHHCRLQREERLAYTRLAERWGCRLIINPDIQFTNYGADARCVRLHGLRQFLQSPAGQKAEVAFQTKMEDTEHITIVGNWFRGMTVSAGKRGGYQQTIFTRHAPSMQASIEGFDEEFDHLLKKAGWSRDDSREQAIAQLTDKINAACPNFDADF